MGTKQTEKAIAKTSRKMGGDGKRFNRGIRFIIWQGQMFQ